MAYKPFADDVLFLANVTFRRGAVNGYVWTSNANGTGSWQPASGGVTPAALTKVDDTNVTLTLGGTPATALLQATSITVGWSGQLSVARGGTGLSALGTALQQLRVNAGGTALEYFTPTSGTTLVVGTTPITSGTVGRILFEGAGNVLQENAILNLDTTNGLIIGGTTARGTRLTAINAADTLASKTLVVRNAADSADRFSVNGNGSISLTASTGNVLHLFDSGSAGSGYLIGSNSAFSGTNSFLQVSPGNITMILNGTTSGFQFTQAGAGGYITQSNQTAILQFSQASTWGSWKFGVGKGNMYLATTIGFSWAGGERGTFAMENAVEPASNTTNAIQIFSKNITNASFHVRDSNSRIFYAGEKVGMRSNHDLQLAANDTVYLTISTAGLVTLADASNIAVGTTTGTKIGTATTQKIGFWNTTPIVQPTTAVGSATIVSPGGGTNIKTDDTFDGYTVQQVVKGLRNIGLLA